MTREQLTAALDVLTAADFDKWSPEASGWEQLADLADDVGAGGDPNDLAPVILRFIERLDGADLGSPGPLVHVLESWLGRYEVHLAESLRRKPTPLTVWMANRIINDETSDGAEWLGLLESVAGDPKASAETRRAAADFLAFQR